MATITVKNSAGVDTTIQAPNANGQATAANSTPVVIASDQSAVPVTVSGTVPVSGALTDTQIRATALPVSAAALPLPTGAATEATLAAQSGKLPASLGQKVMSASLSVAPAADAHQILPSQSSYILPSAAATTNATNVKVAVGTVRRVSGYNAKASMVFLKLYNKATAPTVGTDTPVAIYPLPATSAFAWDVDLLFSTGISFAITGAVANNDTTALVAADVVGLTVAYS